MEMQGGERSRGERRGSEKVVELWGDMGRGEERRGSEGNWVGVVARMEEKWNKKVEESGSGGKR